MSVYNFTVSPFTFTEAVTNAVYAQNMISGGTMTITPNSGYVVSASDFTAAGTLPAQFASISFADSGTAGEIGNTVIVTFVFATLFEMSTGLETINLPISGHARPIDNKRYIDFNIDFVDDTNVNLNGVSTVEKLGTAITKTGGITDSDGIKTTNLSATNITADYFAQIGTLQVTANDSPNFNFTNPPTLTFENLPQGTISLQLDNVVRRDGETETVKTWNYKIMFISDIDITQSSGAKVFINYSPILAKSSIKEIQQVIVTGTEIPINGAKKKIKVIGDASAEFDLFITKASNNTSIISSSNTILGPNSTISTITTQYGVMNGINKTLEIQNIDPLFSGYEIYQSFPSASANEAYHINITPKNGTILNSNLNQTIPQVIINQYINPTITLTTKTAGLSNYSVTTNPTIAYKGKPNKRPGQLEFMRHIVDTFRFKYIFTKGVGGSSFSTADLPTWDSSDLSATTTTSDWEESVSGHGNEIEIVDITLTKNNETTPTIITVEGTLVILKFGTADVTFNLDSSRFLTVT